jgi:antitoxin CptB
VVALTESPPFPTDDATDLQRLRWQCRRGMLELDHLLGRFLDLGYAELSEAERQDFLALLGKPDPHLSDWFMGRSEPPEPRLQALVARILAVVSESPRA